MKSIKKVHGRKRVLKKSFAVLFSIAWLFLLTLGLPMLNPEDSSSGNRQFSSIIGNNAFAATNTIGKASTWDKSFFAQNDILFYTPCVDNPNSSTSGYCGKTWKEKYWSAFSQKFDAVHVAAIMGNIDSEGDSPTDWQVNDQNQPRLGKSWKEVYDECFGNSCTVGIGVVQITSYLSDYLHYISERDPSLIKYFEDLTYDVDGDTLIKMIGESEFEKLMKLELDFIFKELGFETDAPNEPDDGGFVLKDFLAETTVEGAARYWARYYERCGSCETEETLSGRASLAKTEYDDMIDFVCVNSSYKGNSSSSNNISSSNSEKATVSGNEITWIGDSYSVGALEKIQTKFPGVDLGDKNPGNGNSPYSYIQVGKHLDWLSYDDNTDTRGGKSGIDILISIIDKNALRPYLVLALGTNDSMDNHQATLDKINELVKDRGTKVIVVTAKTTEDDQGQFDDGNTAKRKYANEHDNFYVADWAAVAKDEYYEDDDIHLKDQYYSNWVDVISDALSNSSAGGCNKVYENVEDYPQYYQGDYDGVDYGCSGATPWCKEGGICACGCGPSSMAMLVTVATGREVTPIDIASLTLGNRYVDGNRVTATQAVCEKYGCETKQIERTEESIRSALKEGWMVHISGQNLTEESPQTNPFTKGGHYVGIFDIDENDIVTIADSGGRNNGRNNRRMPLSDVIKDSHYAVMAIRGNGNTCSNNTTYCDEEGNNNNTTLSRDILANVQKVIDLANQNGAEYELGGGRSISNFDNVLNNNAKNVIDCTGFASMVYYMTYKDQFTEDDIFSSESIKSGAESSYVRIPLSEVRPGDIFAYGGYNGDGGSWKGHGGIVVEIDNGKVTRIAETGGQEGKSGNNETLGYSGTSDGSVKRINWTEGNDTYFFRWKGKN
ncbi:C39 family peptidase [Candidatus Saccharibacteria bacterium]|nr:C39 family peptidase [Candidatus Saccharibacteria bacterium]